MKRFLLAVLVSMLALSLAPAAFAGDVRDNAGCGIGSMAFGDKDGLLFQLLATTTNGIFGNQTFGMTSGTLGCKPMKGLVSNDVLRFAAANLDNLARDIATGRGETLDTLAELMKISADGRPAFYAALQANFSGIFTSAKVEAGEVIDNILAVTSNI